jgi:hypothetical protein
VNIDSRRPFHGAIIPCKLAAGDCPITGRPLRTGRLTQGVFRRAVVHRV